MNIHTMASLWKTPVDKPVENVENFELSTGIFSTADFHTSVEFLHTAVHMASRSFREGKLRHRAQKVNPAKILSEKFTKCKI